MKKIVFPAPDLLLTFRPLDEIDLPERLDCASVEVIFAAIVLDALVDYQWHHPVPELRRRASEILGDVDEWLMAGQPIRPGVTVTVLAGQPGRTTSERYRLDWQQPEDLLCGVLLEYQQRHPEEEVILLSGASATRERSQELGLQSASLPDEERLPEARTPLEQKRERTDEASAGLRYRASSLKLSFQSGDDKLVIPVLPPLTSLTPAMQAQLEDVVDKVRREVAQYFPGAESEGAPDDTLLPAGVTQRSLAAPDALPDGVSQEEAVRYKHTLKTYPALFESYLQRRLKALNEQRRTIRLNLALDNVGGAPAAEILLTLTLPPGLHWQRHESDLPAPPPPPLAPWLEGQTGTGAFMEGGAAAARDELARGAEETVERPGPSPRISDEGRTLRWELGTSRHHEDRELPSLYVRFQGPEDIGNFAVDYEIEEKHSAGAVHGRLLVKVTTGSETDASPSGPA